MKRLVGTALAAATLVFSAPLVPLTPQAVPPALAQTTKVQLTDRVTDRAGVLSEEEKADLESKYTEFTQSTGLVPFFVLFPDLGSSTGEQVAKQLFSASGGDNVLVFVVGVNDRQVGMQYGADWSQSRVEAIQKNATGALSSSDWAAAGRTLAGGDSDESGWWWLLGGGAVVAGGGAVAASRGRKNRRKQTEAMARDAREISPSDVSRLSSLPTPVLTDLASDVLVRTDEAVRQSKKELELAQQEFGAERTRPFTKAMNHATSTLQHAFELQKRLTDSIPESEAERRAMLVDIVSSCGTSNDALKEKEDEFRSMRDTILNADTVVQDLSSKVVNLHRRLPAARETLSTMESTHGAQAVDSIRENPEFAEAALAEAEKATDEARTLAGQPAGSQGGLISAIRRSEEALAKADELLTAVEHGEDNLKLATDNFESIRDEVAGEIEELKGLSSSAEAAGLVDKATGVLAEAKENYPTDPLAAYASLTAIDAELDALIDTLREVKATHERNVQLLNQTLQSSQATIQSAEDFIATRGRAIGSRARTLLAQAQQTLAKAMSAGRTDPQKALPLASEAGQLAQRSLQAAKRDFSDYQNSMQTRRGGGGGDLFTGLLLGSMLNGGGFGGFGGGGGGSFGGGGGGGSWGGRF
ncbi:TPM domain-containing protein [Corynebacterium pyruviciproducens]|uniref:TPM domain-containing protein n=1 Tax=Corynebacterium pyruviciproducens TaxID=598660 RepID=UPI0023F05B80|nr:TPM domain-containing protein [Corynebacterium pyruviciproducens]